MNRFKKELRLRGYKIESDYEYLPCNGIDTVVVDSEKAVLSKFYYGAGWISVQFDRAFQEVLK